LLLLLLSCWCGARLFILMVAVSTRNQLLSQQQQQQQQGMLPVQFQKLLLHSCQQPALTSCCSCCSATGECSMALASADSAA
jgi:hypothetical protein